ncbi:MAG: tetratricopeptide repeat protein, partial [Burkholderiales bacterium]|nr:tetratricopeptide repeat protein [Burkholderiales bacterium]
IADARAAYQLALSKQNEKNPGRQLTQIKLDSIGAAVDGAVASQVVVQ